MDMVVPVAMVACIAKVEGIMGRVMVVTMGRADMAAIINYPAV